MNYRHAFHAGNFADVLKHAVLCRVLQHLRSKPAAFRVIDTHGGGGLYDLTGPEASRGAEWRDGIARLRNARLAGEAAALLAPYLDTVASFNAGPVLTRYPGSAAIAQAWLRPQDRLIACELEPSAAASLARALGGDPRCKMLRLDGWMALRAQIPPKERRGVVLIDPPFEQPAEFARLQHGIAIAQRKWASGTVIAWYPIKERAGPDALAKGLATESQRPGSATVLRMELAVGAAPEPARLQRCGLIVLNPPWMLEAELAVMLPALAQAMSVEGSGASAAWQVDWVAREK
jgi:23S rRNA (adenine2030-N6)-methyltransferase